MRYLAIALAALLAVTGVGRAEPVPFTYSFRAAELMEGHEIPWDRAHTLDRSVALDGSAFTIETRMGTAVFQVAVAVHGRDSTPMPRFPSAP